MLLANYVPKCQMSSGPLGPVFLKECYLFIIASHVLSYSQADFTYETLPYCHNILLHQEELVPNFGPLGQMSGTD